MDKKDDFDKKIAKFDFVNLLSIWRIIPPCDVRVEKAVENRIREILLGINKQDPPGWYRDFVFFFKENRFDTAQIPPFLSKIMNEV